MRCFRIATAAARLWPAACSFIKYAFASILLLCSVAPAALQTVRLPAGVTFEPSDAANLTFKGKVGERCERSFVIRNRTGNRIRVFGVPLGADEHWDKRASRDKKGVEIEPNGVHTIRVVFQPRAAGVSASARLNFSVRLSQNQIAQGQVQFVGNEGESCEPPPPDEGGGSGATGGGGATGVTHEGFENFGPVRQHEKQQTICVRFHYVNDGWADAGGGRGDRPTKERLQQCLQAASGWYAGVEFVGKPEDAAPDEVDRLGQDITDDTHCINIYIVHANWFETHPEPGQAAGATNKVGNAEMYNPPRGDGWAGTDPPGVKTDLAAAGVNAGYLNQMAPGTRITVETGVHLCSTIAHELGHALGLGLGPNNTHLSPDDGQPINDDTRLMDGNGNGSKLTDQEQLVAKRVAQYMNETLLSKCSGSARILEDSTSLPPPTRNELRYAGIFNQGETVRLSATTAYDFSPGEFTGALIAEFDTNLDGTADHRIIHTRSNGEWRSISEPAATDSLPVLEPSFVTSMHTASPRARGFMLEVLTDFFPPEARVIGWRLTLEVPDADLRSTLPASFDRFDITRPDFAIELAGGATALQGRAGGAVELAGTTVASSTFTGDVRMVAALSDGEQSYFLSLPTLVSPLPAEWTWSLELPDSMRPATYDLSVYAICDECRLSTSIVTQLVIDSGSGTPLPGLVLAAIVVLALIALVWFTMRRRNRRESGG